jgi:hypothetical protein
VATGSRRGRTAAPRPVAGTPIRSIDQLLGLSPQQLDGLYHRSAVGAIPEGRARGQAIFAPGTRLARPMAKAARVLWQGKVFQGAEASAVNRFFGVRMIRADVSYGESWLDGRPAIILDYRDTSRLYANYRDELREVAPGLFLGLMYARTAPRPSLKMYFALDGPAGPGLSGPDDPASPGPGTPRRRHGCGFGPRPGGRGTTGDGRRAGWGLRPRRGAAPAWRDRGRRP